MVSGHCATNLDIHAFPWLVTLEMHNSHAFLVQVNYNNYVIQYTLHSPFLTFLWGGDGAGDLHGGR